MRLSGILSPNVLSANGIQYMIGNTIPTPNQQRSGLFLRRGTTAWKSSYKIWIKPFPIYFQVKCIDDIMTYTAKGNNYISDPEMNSFAAYNGIISYFICYGKQGMIM
jgi:hypothetical protein